LIDSQKADVEARQFAAENHITAVVPTEHHIAVFYCADDSTPHVQVGKMVEKGPPAVMLWCSPEKK
jgi:hypothetical protein